METFVTKSGRVLTDADIEALSKEAERGYDRVYDTLEKMWISLEEPQPQHPQPR